MPAERLSQPNCAGEGIAALNGRKSIRLGHLLQRVFCSLSLWLAFCATSPALAATFKLDRDAKECQLRLDGKINEGDFGRLKSELGDFETSNAGPTLCLNSPDGGDFVEGLEIANFIASGFQTRIEPNAACRSACAWIFLSGINLTTGGSELSRVMNANSVLAFHSPSLDLATFRNESPEQTSVVTVIQAYNQAVAEVAKGLLRLAERRTTESIVPLLPSSLLAQALLKTGTEMLVIGTTGQTIRWDIRVEGYDGVAPRDKTDIIQACRIAQAKVNESWTTASSTDAEGYLAFYNSKTRVFTAQVVLTGDDQNACELKFTYDKDLRHLVGAISVKANLTFEERLGLWWIKDMRDTQNVTLPDLAFLNPSTKLEVIATEYASVRPSDPSNLATLGTPKWCRKQVNKGIDERAICVDGELSALDVLLNDHYKTLLKKLKSNDKRNGLSAEASTWRAGRTRCGGNAGCLRAIYRNAIFSLRDQIWDAEVAENTRSFYARPTERPPSDSRYPAKSSP